MKPQYIKVQVDSNCEIAPGVFSLNLRTGSGFSTEGIVPGQFYMLRSWNSGPLLSRPISVCSYDDKGITFLYTVVGKGTELFKKLVKDDEIEILGPLGNGFDTGKIKGRVAIVAGGIGIAPMVQLVRELWDCETDVYAGFRNSVYSLEGMRDYVKEIHVSTEDGSTGYKGYVTDLFDAGKYDMVICCGPEVMMLKVVKLCRDKKVPVYVSMEKHMACGVGACLVCTCRTKDGNKRTCKEGPVFFGDDLEIDGGF